jgi:hypothetical protein
MDANHMIQSVTTMIRTVGVKVKLTKVDGTATGTAVAAMTSIKLNPQVASSTVQAQSRLYLPVGRFVPEVGDFVSMPAGDFRIKAVEAAYMLGKPVVYMLDLT